MNVKLIQTSSIDKEEDAVIIGMMKTKQSNALGIRNSVFYE